jgi:hypothetical protein
MPSASDVKLQPIAIPSGWHILRNDFYAIDPNQSDWDAIEQYFEGTYLWIAMREDNLREITLDWVPMDDRHGEYRLRLYHQQPLKFSRIPKQQFQRLHDGTELTYKLVNPVVPPTREDVDRPEKALLTRDRLLVIETMEKWMSP